MSKQIISQYQQKPCNKKILEAGFMGKSIYTHLGFIIAIALVIALPQSPP